MSENYDKSAVHDIANAVASIQAWIELTRSGETSTDRALQAIETATGAIKAATESIAGRDAGAKTISLARLARGVEAALAPLAQSHQVSVRVEDHGSPSFELPEGQVVRLLWNVVLNAIEACRAGDSITIRVDNNQLTVEDSGPGMTPDLLQSILEPGVSTRGEGRGQGLAIVNGIVHDLGGLLEIDSDIRTGTKVSFSFPKQRPKRSGARLRWRMPERALVVEDDEGIQQLIRHTLEVTGVEVVCVSTAKEAMSAPGRFDVAILDLTLPDGGGIEFVERFRASKIAAQLIIASGRSDEVPLGPRDHRLRKPFEPGELVAAIANIQAPGQTHHQ